MRLIDGDALYKAMQDAEDLARQRVLDTESTLPYPNNLNPSYTRYLAQMDERTKAKHMIADAPTVDAVPAGRCEDCARNADNGGVYDDGRTRCPIQEHYVLLLDGYCHLWEECKDGEHAEGTIQKERT